MSGLSRSGRSKKIRCRYGSGSGSTSLFCRSASGIVDVISVMLTNIPSLTGTMSSPQRPDCVCRCSVHTRHTGLWCGTLDKTPAAINPALVSQNARMVSKCYRRCQHAASKPHSVSLHLMLDHGNIDWLWLKLQYINFVFPPPFAVCTSCPVNCFVASSLVFTNFLMSRSSLFPKS